MIVNAGLNLIRSFLRGDAPDYPRYGAVGAGTTDPVAGDTALEDEKGTRQEVSPVNQGDGIVDFVWTLPATEANGETLTEVGVLTALTSGTLFNRAEHIGFAKTSSFAVKYRVRHTQVNV